MSVWPIAAGVLTGLGCSVAIGELVPARPDLRAAVGRLQSGDPVGARSRTGLLEGRIAAAMPWLPVPTTDLRLLGQDPAAWLASKVACGVAGVAVVPAFSALLAAAGRTLSWTVPVGGALVLGAAMFLLPDIVTRVNARQQRADFRHALCSYVDLVALERGAGAAPTEALEAAATVGAGWAFERIAAALDQARRASLPPWDGLSELAREIGITELADVADIAGVAGQDGAKIIDTLSARAESMRAQQLAAMRAQAAARSTTMVLPIALLAGGFLVLLIFPDFYRLFG